MLKITNSVLHVSILHFGSLYSLTNCCGISKAKLLIDINFKCLRNKKNSRI